MTTTTIAWNDHGVFDGDGTVGGDGASESVSRRFATTTTFQTGAYAGSYAVVTSYYDPVNIGERFGEDHADAARFDVENHHLWTYCTDLEDIDESTTWDDVDYTFPSAVSFPTEEDAHAYCLRMAACEDPEMYGAPTTWGLR